MEITAEQNSLTLYAFEGRWYMAFNVDGKSRKATSCIKRTVDLNQQSFYPFGE